MNYPLFLAQALPNVADVTQQGETMLETAKAFIATRGLAFGLNVLAALAIFFVGRWLANLVVRFMNRVLTRAKVDETLIKFASNVAYILMLVFLIIASLNRLGVDTTSLSAIIAAAGLAIGLALQGSLGNFAAGVMLIFFKPFRAGDFVEAGGTSGIVQEIQIFNTILHTADNVRIIIPNGSITSGKITNFSVNETRRIDLTISCGYGDDLKGVKTYLEELVKSDQRILAEPEPVVAVNELGESSVNFVVRPWVKSSDYWDTRWDLTERIKVDFDEKGFNIPYPTRDIHVHQEA